MKRLSNAILLGNGTAILSASPNSQCRYDMNSCFAIDFCIVVLIFVSLYYIGNQTMILLHKDNIVQIKKAFCAIDHSILIDKLVPHGVRGTAIKRIVNYLNCRQQYVQIDNVHSVYREVIHGISQGSILEPRLFLYLY